MHADQGLTENLSFSNQLSPGLVEAAIEITGQRDLGQVLAKILDHSSRLCSADGSGIILLDKSQDKVEIFLSRGSLSGLTTASIDLNTLERVYQLSGPTCLETADLEEFFPGSPISGQNYLSPITGQEGIVGLLLVNRRKRAVPFCPTDETILVTLSKIASVAIETARSFFLVGEKARILERDTLARALHSSAAQTIFILDMEVDTALQIDNLPEMRQRLISLRRLAVRAGEEIRDLITVMRSHQDSHQNPIVSLIQRRLNAFQSQTDIPVSFYADPLTEILPAVVVETVYRLVMEFLDLVKTQLVSALLVSLNRDPGKLTIYLCYYNRENFYGDEQDFLEFNPLRILVENVNGGACSTGLAEEGARYFRASFNGVV